MNASAGLTLRGAVSLAFAAACILWVYSKVRRKYWRRLPPGPKSLPILGNIGDIPPANVPAFRHWLQHRNLYGPISSLTVLGTTYILIHDRQVADDILNHRSFKTSGRPETVFASKLARFGQFLALHGYDDQFRKQRKLIHRELEPKSSIQQFHALEETEVNRQLSRALKEPTKWLDHLRKTAGGIILSMTYGYTIEPDKPDRLVDLIEQTIENGSHAAAPMAWLVDMIPALQYLPDGFPGTAFKKAARIMQQGILETVQVPYQFVRNQIAAGCNKPSYVSSHIQRLETTNEMTKGIEPADEDAIMWSAAMMFTGGAETTAITMTAFTLAMVLYPEVQRKAQAEIDLVVGSHRLPEYADRDKLPYVNALVKESLRWWSVFPLCIPHRADQGFQYREFYIPKNAIILPSIYWMMHDPAVYDHPDSFEPERFLSPRNQPDPSSIVFGYGRRICPGRFLADSSLYLNIARSLAVFSFGKALDTDGKEINIDIVETPALLNHMMPFKFQIRPRVAQRVELIKQLELNGLFEEGDAVHLPDVAG